ncbi:hypothetical protein ACLOJK_013750 [Asimina triloba]
MDLDNRSTTASKIHDASHLALLLHLISSRARNSAFLGFEERTRENAPVSRLRRSELSIGILQQYDAVL